MGEVILGMPGQWAHDYREKADHYTSKIGGLPDWPDLDIPVSGKLLLCDLCGGKLCLVAQIYAPLSMAERSIDERVIYVLGCMKKDCGSNPQSWRVLRLQRCKQDIESKDEPLKAEQPEEESTSVAEDKPTSQSSSVKVCDDEDSDSDIDLDDLAQALEQAATLASNSKKQDGTKHTRKIVEGPVAKKLIDDLTTPVLPCFYIYSQRNSSEGRMDKANFVGGSSISLKEIEKSSGNESEGESWEGEAYEYDKALGADRTYLKFKKQLDAYPEQCFRYSYGGNALFPVANVPKPGACKICGSARRFELQLMPPLLYFLQEASDDSSNFSINGWTWLTIIIFTCPKNCCSGTCDEKSSNSCRCIVEEEAIVIQDD
ncbi:Programmed cell death protein 2-like [Rhynchospora pubera]|uniref:Programmed cell death protein 2-like n=1 Tax=Rhynchospora pubera TaxID=906938 RepID=A0AAV8CXM9_9POAL|nr:Programmed cell death protein 2-like [Rhynchospora pubera]